MKTCLCTEADRIWPRTNPTTGEKLLLCMRHAMMHDKGHGGIEVVSIPTATRPPVETG